MMALGSLPSAAGQTAMGSTVPSAATYALSARCGGCTCSPSGTATRENAARMTGRKAPAIMRRRNRSKIVTEPFETIVVDTDRVPCDGGGGPLGHPKVYLNLGKDGRVECPY